MNKYYLLTLIIIFNIFSTRIYAKAHNSEIISLGKATTDSLYELVIPEMTDAPFPAIYVYSTKDERFLSKIQVKNLLSKEDSDKALLKAVKYWSKDTNEFNTNNKSLLEAAPNIKLDKEYIILYHNLPAGMMQHFTAMDPELINKDKELRKNLLEMSNARSYSVY